MRLREVSLHEVGVKFVEYLTSGCNRREGREKKDFKKGVGASWVKGWMP